MTTSIVVRALHGWPVKVTPIDTSIHGDKELPFRVVEAGKEETFAIWDGRDVRIHEIQPREADPAPLLETLWPAVDP